MLADLHTNPHPRSLRSLTLSLKGVKGRSRTLVVGQVAHFNLTPEALFMLMV